MQKNQDAWLILNKKYDFCCEPVKRLDEVICDPNLGKSGTIISLNNIKQAGYPALFSSFAALKYRSAPKLGQHTKEVLSGLKSKTGNRMRRFKK